MHYSLKTLQGVVLLAAAMGVATMGYAQASDSAALEAVRAAVKSELQAAQTDRSIWIYTEHDTTVGRDAVYDVVETPHGTLKRLIELNGRRLTGAAEQTETQRIENYVHDPSAQARARRAGAHDDAQATEMLKMLPDAFIWRKESETGGLLTLKYWPNQNFDPPNMQARVMGTMAGEMVISRDGDRIRSLRGALTSNVLIGFGILGKLDRGGIFDVERRKQEGGSWQITETRVHIGGHALLFKTIGQQEDDIKTNWKPSTAHSLEDAARLLHAEP
jgi:hypothetical protein